MVRVAHGQAVGTLRPASFSPLCSHRHPPPLVDIRAFLSRRHASHVNTPPRQLFRLISIDAFAFVMKCAQQVRRPAALMRARPARHHDTPGASGGAVERLISARARDVGRRRHDGRQNREQPVSRPPSMRAISAQVSFFHHRRHGIYFVAVVMALRLCGGDFVAGIEYFSSRC